VKQHSICVFPTHMSHPQLIPQQEHDHIMSRSHNFVSEGKLKTSYQPTHPVIVY